MPHILVMADRPGDRRDGPVMLRERVNTADFESDHFASMLVERLGWAVGDAVEVEQTAEPDSVGDAVEVEQPAEPQRTEEEDYRRSASVVTTAS